MEGGVEEPGLGEALIPWNRADGHEGGGEDLHLELASGPAAEQVRHAIEQGP